MNGKKTFIRDILLDFDLCLVSSPSPRSLVFKNGSFFASKLSRNAFEASSLALIAGNVDSVFCDYKHARKLEIMQLRSSQLRSVQKIPNTKNLLITYFC